MRSALRGMLSELPGALLLATLTAVVTMVLLVILSFVLGAETRERAEQQRCYAALSNAMLHDLLDAHGIVNDYPRVNPAGVDCSFIEEPIEP